MNAATLAEVYFVSFLRSFCRAVEATGMPLDDPERTSRSSARCDAAILHAIRIEW